MYADEGAHERGELRTVFPDRHEATDPLWWWCQQELPRLQRTVTAVVNESEKHDEDIRALKAAALTTLFHCKHTN